VLRRKRKYGSSEVTTAPAPPTAAPSAPWPVRDAAAGLRPIHRASMSVPARRTPRGAREADPAGQHRHRDPSRCGESPTVPERRRSNLDGSGSQSRSDPDSSTHPAVPNMEERHSFKPSIAHQVSAGQRRFSGTDAGHGEHTRNKARPVLSAAAPVSGLQ
jgi:hypothetical protein